MTGRGTGAGEQRAGGGGGGGGIAGGHPVPSGRGFLLSVQRLLLYRMHLPPGLVVI